MKEHPSIFTGDSVPQILAGRKTMTRRVVTARNSYLDGGTWPKGMFERMRWDEAFVDPGPSPIGNPGPYLHVPYEDGLDRSVHRVYPRVLAGDRLWVKETWAVGPKYDSTPPRDIPHDEYFLFLKSLSQTDEGEGIRGKWRSPLYMPRWASRLLLEVTGIIIERVQGITHEDALAEGCPPDVPLNNRCT